MAPKFLADARACLAHIDQRGGCRITAERADLMAKPKHHAPLVAEPGPDGVITPVSELNEQDLTVALARHVYPKDIKRAVGRLTKVNGLRPLRPASQVCSGKSILDLLWEELDAVVERLMARAAGEDDKGKAQGVAYAIAVILNPYLPNVEAVRDQAMLRWEADNG